MPSIYVNDWPQYSEPDVNRRENTLVAARLMVNAAMTAPNAGGISQVEAEIVYGMKDQEMLARKMEELAQDNQKIDRRFKYEAVMVRESDCIIILGNFRAMETPMDANCGGCGGIESCSFLYERRNSTNGLIDITDRSTPYLVDGPLCCVRTQDLGYAMGSALWMANRLLVDARPFFTVGIAGQKMGYCMNSVIAVGICCASLSKNPFVDINTDYHLLNLSKLVDSLRKQYAIGRQLGGDYRITDPGDKHEKARRKKQEGK